MDLEGGSADKLDLTVSKKSPTESQRLTFEDKDKTATLLAVDSTTPKNMKNDENVKRSKRNLSIITDHIEQ